MPIIMIWHNVFVIETLLTDFTHLSSTQLLYFSLIKKEVKFLLDSLSDKFNVFIGGVINT